MSVLGGRTKKVTTYGRKKTQIITVHSDLSAAIPASPIAVKSTRPILQSKLSNDITNIPSVSTPLPKSKLGKGKEFQYSTAKHVDLTTISPPSSPDIIFKARKVNRPGRKVLPRSPSCSPAKTPKPTQKSKSGKLVLDSVTIPIRSTQKKLRTSVVGDLTKRLREVTIDEASPPASNPVETKDKVVEPKKALDSLLESCSSSTIHSFTTFLQSNSLPGYGSVTKVGEASYSEVFGLTASPSSDTSPGEVQYVLKVIPLFDSAQVGDAPRDKPMPDSSEMEDVKREIELTKRMGDVPGGGFVTFIGAYVVEGEYPATLLDQWDEYKSTLGSASVRPSVLPRSQKYCLLVLSNAGQDLETYKFPSATGWLQAAGVFWQIVSALARAEEWTEFEHRDLHEGQILISAYSAPTFHDVEVTVGVDNYLLPSVSGIQITIIDFGLSRLSMPGQSSSSPDSSPNSASKSTEEAIWSPLPAEVYEGKGAQWDLYRAMRDRVESEGEGNWEDFHPITNVMWLHYILRYTQSKLRPPKAPTSTRRVSRTTSTALFDEMEKAYLALGRIEKVLGWSIDFSSTSRRRGLRGDQDTFLDKKLVSAGDVLSWGKEEGWVWY